MNFTAIDFETANSFRRSACSLGLIRVENSQIVERKHWLIKPTPFEIGFYQHKVHNIGLSELINKPTFDSIWSEIKPYIENQYVVAHNGSFDFGVLKHVWAHYDISAVSFTPLCSLVLSRLVWQGELSYSLSYLARTKLNHSFNHHNALEDAEACTKLFLKIKEEINIDTIDQLQNYPSFSNEIGTKQSIIRSKKTFDGIINENSEHSFYQQEVVFTGSLEYFTRDEAKNVIEKIGGTCSNSVTSNTKYLVMGMQDLYKVGQGLKSSKVKKAEALAQKGNAIQLLDEKEFMELLN